MNDQTDLDRERAQLLEAMSAVSEDRTCCGWASDWARTLHAEGGVWETLGRAVGWPTGNYDQWVWVSWDEAARLYGHAPAATPAGPAPATDRGTLRDRIARALVRYDWNAGLSGRDTPSEHHYGEADAVLAVLPATVDRAAVLAEVEQAVRTVASNCAYEADAGCDFCNGVDAALTRVRRLAGEAQQDEAQQDPTQDGEDTLPAWLNQRFGTRGQHAQTWEQLSDDDRAYWQHEARAVRRAVERNGFKRPAVTWPGQPETEA